MVTKKKEKESRFDVTVKYRDGGVDNFYGLKSARILDNVIELGESNDTTVYLVLNVVTYFRMVEVKE